MKVTINLEFTSEQEAAEYLSSKRAEIKTSAPVSAETAQLNREHAQISANKVAAPQTYQATTQAVPMTPIEKARATKAANQAKKLAEQQAATVAAPASTVPTSAFPAPPSQPLSPIPAAPQGVPMPSGMPGMQPPAVNYGAPMNAPAPMNMAPPAPQQTYQAPVAPAPVQQQAAQAWDKVRVVNELQQTAENAQAKGLNPDVIRGIFGTIFQEQGITPGPLGQLNDQDVYKFQLAFYPKLQAAQGNTQNLI